MSTEILILLWEVSLHRDLGSVHRFAKGEMKSSQGNASCDDVSSMTAFPTTPYFIPHAVMVQVSAPGTFPFKIRSRMMVSFSSCCDPIFDDPAYAAADRPTSRSRLPVARRKAATAADGVGRDGCNT